MSSMPKLQALVVGQSTDAPAFAFKQAVLHWIAVFLRGAQECSAADQTPELASQGQQGCNAAVLDTDCGEGMLNL